MMTARKPEKITRRWRIGEAADLVGVSSQAIRDAEKAGRLPHPDMETRGRVEQRVGYTIEQINHMRDVFGTRLRRSEDTFPPVIGVAAHKGGVYKTSVSVHLARGSGAERVAGSAGGGERPAGDRLDVSRMGTRSSYSRRRYPVTFFIWVNGMMPATPSNRPAGRVWTLFLPVWRSTVSRPS